MHRHTLVAALIAVTCGIAAPAAAAQAKAPVPLDSTYTSKAIGHNGTPSCPGAYVACGEGTDPAFGPFAYGTVVTPTGQITTLTFTTGTLVLDETPSDVSGPGQGLASGGGVANQPPWAFGHPGTFTQTWTVDPTSSGSFSGATGSGTDPQHAAGIRIGGVLVGTIAVS